MPRSKVANGNIAPCRFVKDDSTATGKVLQAGTGDRTIGISQKGTRFISGLGSLDDGYAAIAGENLEVFMEPDDTVALQLGGTVSNGQRLKSDTDGKGVASTTDKEQFGAIAMSDGTLDQIIPVRCHIGEVSV